MHGVVSIQHSLAERDVHDVRTVVNELGATLAVDTCCKYSFDCLSRKAALLHPGLGSGSTIWISKTLGACSSSMAGRALVRRRHLKRDAKTRVSHWCNGHKNVASPILFARDWSSLRRSCPPRLSSPNSNQSSPLHTLLSFSFKTYQALAARVLPYSKPSVQMSSVLNLKDSSKTPMSLPLRLSIA